MTAEDDNRGGPLQRTRRCAIYARKAATAQDRGPDSLEAQCEACRQYVRTQPGWIVLPLTYIDVGFTAADDERPALQRLLWDVDHGEVDVVVVHRWYRLAHSFRQLVGLRARFDRMGTERVTVAEVGLPGGEPSEPLGGSR